MPGAGVLQPLEIDIVQKLYRRSDGTVLEALSNLKFTVPPGEVTCLIGPSGCGKTTTLRILLGVDRDFAGRITPDPARLVVGMVFQDPRLLPWRTIDANVRLALPFSRRDTDLDSLFADLGLAEWRTHYPGELSLGMARRVSLTRALAVEPSLLVLDEPFVSLDERAAGELRGFVFGAVAARRMTALMVTHNLREAIELADRLVLLTPRPASVLAEVSLDEPRAARSEAWIEERRAALAAAYPAVLA